MDPFPREEHHEWGSQAPPDTSPAEQADNTTTEAGAVDGVRFALHSIVDHLQNNAWTRYVETKRREATIAGRELSIARLERINRSLADITVAPISDLVQELNPNSTGPVACGMHEYFPTETDEDWARVEELLQEDPDKYTDTQLGNIGYTDLVRLLGWHNMDEPRDEQVSARSLLGSYKDQPKIPLSVFGVNIPGGVRPSPPDLLNPRAVAIALAADTELRAAGLLTQRGMRTQRLEAQTHLERMPPLVWAPRFFSPLRRIKPESYWDVLHNQVANGNPKNDLIALRLVLDALHPDYDQYAMGRSTHLTQTEWAHRRHLHTKMRNQAGGAVLSYGMVKAGLSGNLSTFGWARAIAEADLRLLEGDAGLTTQSGRRITEYRDRRLVQASRGSLPHARNLQPHVAATVAFCQRRYNDTWQRGAQIEHSERRKSFFRSLVEATNAPTL